MSPYDTEDSTGLADFGSGILRLSPNDGTQQLNNDDDHDGDENVALNLCIYFYFFYFKFYINIYFIFIICKVQLNCIDRILWLYINTNY